MTATYVMTLRYSTEIDSFAFPHQHRARINLDPATPSPAPGTPLSNIQVETNGTGLGSRGSTDAETAMSEWLAAFVAYAATNVTVTDIDLQFYEFGLDNSGVYINAANLSDTATYPSVSGVRTPAATKGQQETLTFRDTRGGTSRLVTIECGAGQELIYGSGTLPAPAQTYVDYILGPNGVICGAPPKGVASADNSRLLTLSKFLQTQNSAVNERRTRGR